MHLKPLLILIAIFPHKDKMPDLNKNNYLNHPKIILTLKKNKQKEKQNKIFFILLKKKRPHYLNLKSKKINPKN